MENIQDKGTAIFIIFKKLQSKCSYGKCIPLCIAFWYPVWWKNQIKVATSMNWQKKSILGTDTLRKYLAKADPEGDVGSACPPIWKYISWH